MPRNGDRIPLIERFSTKYQTNEDGCWLWTSAAWANAAGDMYPVIWVGDGKTDYAHRVSYRMFKGDIPDGYCVCHKCDCPLCVNPEHLFIGTHADNAADRENKGRHRHERRYNHEKIANMLMAGLKHTDIMKETGISRSQLKRIVVKYGLKRRHSAG